MNAHGVCTISLQAAVHLLSGPRTTSTTVCKIIYNAQIKQYEILVFIQHVCCVNLQYAHFLFAQCLLHTNAAHIQVNVLLARLTTPVQTT
jgi:hypothetical protein